MVLGYQPTTINLHMNINQLQKPCFVYNFYSKLNHILLLTFALALSACVEPFEFESSNERPVVIIEGYVSDVSSNDYLALYGDPRFFYVKVKYAGTVKNNLDLPISEAEVELISDQDEHWDYTENPAEPGTYYLYYPDFGSQPHVSYKVAVTLPNGEQFESEFDQMPPVDVRGELSKVETTQFRHSIRADGEVIREYKGLDVNIQMPSFADDTIRYYRWDFDVTFKLIAELIPRSHPQGVCWIDEHYRIDSNPLVRQRGEAANVNLFFLQTSGNQRTKFGYAVRIKQQAVSKKYHQFWADLQNQEKQADLFAPPPYNLFTNIHGVGQEREVYGFFGVVNEEFYNWYYDRYDLSYTPYYIEECFVVKPTDPAEWCNGCLAYGGIRKGDRITNVKPIWWTFD